MVKRRRQVVSAVARTKLAKSFRVGDGKFLVRAKSLDSVAQFLGLRHSYRSRTDFGNHADDAIVGRSPIDRVYHVAQRLFLGQQQLCCRRLWHIFQVRLFEIGFENSLGWNFAFRADHSHHHDDHSDQPQSA